MDRKLKVVLAMPAEAELPLLAELTERDDVDIAAVIDPTGKALGGAIAEIMGLRVFADFATANPPADTTVVLPQRPSALANDLAVAAEVRGLEVVRAADLLARLRRGSLLSRREAPPLRDLSVVEIETASVQSSLAQLEDALAGDTLMQRVVELATRAVGARTGSLMLLDESARELYIAYASGLSEGTLNRTRVRVGERIAGRVARTRQAELIEGAGEDASGRDRPDIRSAICVPLEWEGRLLGVLNVSTAGSQPALRREDLGTLTALGRRFGLILHRVLRLQHARATEVLRLCERRLRDLSAQHATLPPLLAAWAGALAVTAAAERVTIALVCEDGSLLLGEGDASGQTRDWREALENPAWREVLGDGAPLLVRQDEPASDDGPTLSAFYLPIGREPVIAALGVQFQHGGAANTFHALAGEMVGLVEMLLQDQVVQRTERAQRDRLAQLSHALVDVAAPTLTVGQAADAICRQAARLTGARFAVAVATCEDGDARLAGGNAPEDARWLASVPDMLAQAAGDGWRITTLGSSDLVGPEPLSVLVATASAGEATPALVLLGKTPVHPLDGVGFTSLDAEIAAPLAAFLGRVPTEAPIDLASLAASVLEPAAAADTPDPLPSPSKPKLVPNQESQLLRALTREIDRCNRYHNVFGLVLLRPLPGQPPLPGIAARLDARLRSSDLVFELDGGEIAILVPEDVMNLPRLERRLRDHMKALGAGDGMFVQSSHVIYPGPQQSAREILARARTLLTS